MDKDRHVFTSSVKKRKFALRPATRKMLQKGLFYLLIILFALAIRERLDFSMLDIGSALFTILFTGAWLALSHIFALKKSLKFRNITLIYWSVAGASSLLEILCNRVALLNSAAAVVGAPHRWLAAHPLKGLFLLTHGEIPRDTAVLAAEAVMFALFIGVYYVTMWRNAQVLLE